MYNIKQQASDFIVREILDLSTGSGNFSYFTLEKRNWDTVRACQEIAKRLGIHPRQISAAGMKDKYSESRQTISIENVTPKFISTLNIKDIKLTYIGNGKNPISIGSAKGNSFEIIVRHLTNPLPNVTSIPNYYDAQRFGSIRPNTILVGKKILENNLEEAMHIYLGKPYRREGKRDRTFRKDVDSKWGKWHEIRVPRGMDMEYRIIKYLDDRPGDFAGAFKILPRQIGTLFLQSYQSYLFNLTLARYIRENFETISSRYVLGEFIFPKKQSFKELKVPVIGYDMKSSKEFDGIIKDILKAENIKPEDFKLKSISSFSSRSIMRDAFVRVINPTVSDLQADELNPGFKKQLFNFSLSKGSYATIVIRYAYDLSVNP